MSVVDHPADFAFCQLCLNVTSNNSRQLQRKSQITSGVAWRRVAIGLKIRDISNSVNFRSQLRQGRFVFSFV